MVDGPDDALDDVAVLAESIGVEDGHGHDAHAIEPDAGNAGAVVGGRGDDSGHRGAVAVRVVGRVGARDEAGATDELAGEVRVSGIDAGIEDGDNGRSRGIDGAVDIVPADVRERPLAAVLLVVGAGLGRAHPIELDAADGGIGAQRADDRCIVGDADDGHPQGGDRVDDLGAGVGEDPGPLGRAGAGHEGHDVVGGVDRGRWLGGCRRLVARLGGRRRSVARLDDRGGGRGCLGRRSRGRLGRGVGRRPGGRVRLRRGVGCRLDGGLGRWLLRDLRRRRRGRLRRRVGGEPWHRRHQRGDDQRQLAEHEELRARGTRAACRRQGRFLLAFADPGTSAWN